jgi:hypothetical protein
VANLLINELPSKTTDSSTNEIPLWQIGDGTTRKMTWANFAAWQAQYMIDNSLISPGGGDFYKNGSVLATGTFIWNLTPDSGSQITNNANPTSARLKLTNDTNNLVGYTTNVSDAIAGAYISTDKSFSIYSKVGATVFKMARMTGKEWFQPTANAAAEVRLPRTFVQATEPNAAYVQDGDIWLW